MPVHNTNRDEALSDQALRALIDGVPDLIMVVDPRTLLIQEVNSAASELTGYPRDELLRMTVADLRVPEERASLAAVAEATLATGGTLTPYRATYLTRTGRRVPFEFMNRVIGWEGRQVVLASGRDISERVSAIERAEARAHQQAAVAALSQRALASEDLQALFDETAAMVAQTFGVEHSSILVAPPGSGRLILRAGVEWPLGAARWAARRDGTQTLPGYALAIGVPVIVDDLRVETRFAVAPELLERGVLSSLNVVIGGHEKQFGLLGAQAHRVAAFTADDAHFMESIAGVLAAAIERRRAEEELRRSRDQFDTILRNVEDGIIVQSPEGGLLFASEAGARLMGYPSAAALLAAEPAERAAKFTIMDEFGEPLQRELLPGSVALRGETAPEAVVRYRVVETGEERWSATHATPILDDKGNVRFAVSVFHDITPIKQREAELRTRGLQQAAIAELGQRALAGNDLDLLFEEATNICARILHIGHCNVLEFQPADNSFMLRGGTGARRGLVGSFTVPVDKTSMIGLTLLTGESLATEDMQSDPRFGRGLLAREYGLVSGACVAIPGRKQPFGVLSAHSTRRRPFSTDDIHFLEAIAHVLAAAIARHRDEDELRRSRDRLDALFRGIADGIVVQDREGHVQYANAAAVRLLGYPSAAALGMSSLEEAARYLEFHDEHGRELPLEELPGRRLLRGEENPEALVHLRERETGLERWTIIKASPLLDEQGEIQAIVALFHDVTERRRAEELQRTAANLTRSNAALQEFAYVASHDLQEPLRMVASYTQLLQRRYSGRLDADANEFIGYAVDGAVRMKALITDLLAYSRVETQVVPPETVDCRAVVERVLGDLQLAIADAGGAVDVGALPLVLGDATQLGQVFQNLIGNALKFRGEWAPVVSVRARRLGGAWEFAISDNGIGIDPEYRERIFAVFQRLHSREEYPGTGIGLAVCKKIVERHGGRIWVESEPEAGATFRFTLPVLQEAERAG